jgi:hypothetical protein
METYKKNKKQLMAKIEDYMENYSKYAPAVLKQKTKLRDQYFSGNKLYGVVSNG